MITILYTYRDKDIKRVKNSLLSLQNQTNQSFEISFVDYGSSSKYGIALALLLNQFSTINYHYSFVKNQPWSRSKAINIGLKKIETPHVFIADIDMIFHENFIEKLYNIANPNVSTYFKVGFLNESETAQNKDFASYNIAYESTIGAQGLSLFPMIALNKINGFDEFYHFWGAEDTDIHFRMQNAGFEVEFYDLEILMLHQWHPSYRSTEQKNLTQDLQLSGVVQMNHEHLKDAIASKRTKVNDDRWGILVSSQEYMELQNPELQTTIMNQKASIDHFLYFNLKQKTIVTTEYIFQVDPEQGSIKQRIKKLLGKKTPHYYSLKEINDFILLHLISNPSLKKYRYKVAPDLKSISLIF